MADQRPTSSPANREAPDRRQLAEVPRLALRPAEAAEAIGLGVRKLWELTNAGRIPHVRVGKAVLYPVDQLRDWLAEQARSNGNGRGCGR